MNEFLLVLNGSHRAAEKAAAIQQMTAGLLDSLRVCIVGSASETLHLPEGVSAAFRTQKPSMYGREGWQIAQALAPVCRGCAGVLIEESPFATGLATTLSCKLGTACLQGLDAIRLQDGRLWGRKRAYASNLQAWFPAEGTLVGTVRCEDMSLTSPGRPTELQFLGMPETPDCMHRIFYTEKQAEDGLKNARLLLVAGKGVCSQEYVLRLERLAHHMGGGFGITRAVAMAGWAEHRLVIGQSGILCAPALCVLFGVSGAAPFLVGVEKARRIIAINTDTSAAVFRRADQGIRADCRQIIEEWEKRYDANHPG